MAIYKSIKKKIRNSAIASSTIALTLTFAFSAYYQITTTSHALNHEMNTLAQMTAQMSKPALFNRDKEWSATMLDSLTAHKEIISAAIVNAQGEALAEKVFQPQAQQPTTPPGIAERLASRLGIAPSIDYIKPVLADNVIIGQVRISISTQLVWKKIGYALSVAAAAILFALLLSLTIMRRLNRHFMTPISRLSESASSIASTHQYSDRISKMADDELGMMTDQFNLMLNEIEKRDIALSNQTTFLETEVHNRTIALKNSVEEMRSLLNSMAEGAYGVDNDGICTFVNASFLKILGYSSTDEIVGKPIQPLIQHSMPDGSPYPKGKLRDAFLRKENIHASDEVFWRQDGTAVAVEYWSQPITVDGEMRGAIVTFIDISERNQLEKSLRIAAISFESQEGMIVTDANSTILRVNHAFTEITGFSAEESIGKTLRTLGSDLQDDEFYTAMWQHVHDTGSWDGEIWNKRKDGHVYPERFVITAVKDSQGVISNYVASLTDITLKKAAAAEIENLAFYDPLTQLPNRRLLLDRLKQALTSSSRSGKDGALLFLDLDHFKTLNDTLGHDVGDLLLQQVALRLTSCVRQGDTVARLGGDEFVVLLEGLSELTIEAAQQTELIGEKIITALNQPYQLGAIEYSATPSIGVVLFSNHEKTQESLLKHADIAMYQAKKAGRNQLSFFNPHMQDAINVRADLERELHKALHKEQFELYYQMQVDSTGQHLGAEALIRWLHPERGLVSPMHFIPLAEETGLILLIGQWVLDTACAQIKSWQDSDHTRHLTLSVNVSAKQFRQADFVAQVQSIIAKHDIDPMLLKLELTESMLLDDIEDIIVTMNALKSMGIRFSLDDFGTGYSSLQYLKKLPLYQLKIDRSFVRDIATDSSDRTLVLTIITMANNLDLNVIAEGVETEEQRQFLAEKNCTQYQGFLFSKPLPIHEFHALLKAA